jgi:peptidoglycan hydrolase CwlO-like protein
VGQLVRRASLGCLPTALDNRARRRVACVLALLLAALCGFAAFGDRAAAQDPTELQSRVDELEGVQAQQGDLEAEIERQNAEVNELIAREAAVREREAAVADELSATQARLDEANAEVERERAHLVELRARLERARRLLAKLLVGIYETGSPDTLSVILESHSWSDVLAQAEYLDRIQEYDESVIARVETLAAEVESIVERLEATRDRIAEDRDAIAAQRDELASARGEIEAQHADLVAARAERRESLQALQAREQDLQKEIEPSQKEIEPSAPPPGGQTATLVNGRAIPPANAPVAVRSAIEAGNRIVGLPYVWGGGHGSFESSGYDCSGTVSYALHGGGFLSSPLDSSGLTAWGSPGPGSWITVYASSGHAYVVIAGLRLDTSGTVGGSGPSWSTEMRSSSGFVARHPDGY